MRKAIATVCLSGTLEEKLDAAAAAGFDAVELFETDLITSPLTPAAVRERASDLGLGIDLYQPFRDFEGVRKPDFRRAEAKFALMCELGAPTLLVCSNVRPDTIDDDGLAAEQLHVLAQRAAEHGLRIAYEALAWGTHVSSYEHAWRIVRDADHPALGTCLDSFHVLSRGHDPSGIRSIPAERIFFLQLADAPRQTMDVLQWSRHHRCFPGQGGFDVAGFLEHVLATGYDGPLSLEVFNDVFRAADPRRMAVDAMRSLLVLEDELPCAPKLHGIAAAEPGSIVLRSADPARSNERVQALLAPALDGTDLTFCEPGQGRADIDHITLAGPLDRFDEALLYLRAALDLEPQESLELPSPDGLVRSRALTNADRSVRIVLNVGSDFEHVAYATDDALAAARTLRGSGTELLEIPGNYYDDLAARTTIDVEPLRELGVLYDRDDAGEFLHFYTATLPGHRFFEVVERRGGYDGYGAANSPVRMGAQRARRKEREDHIHA